jgi:hypothetical protein
MFFEWFILSCEFIFNNYKLLTLASIEKLFFLTLIELKDFVFWIGYLLMKYAIAIFVKLSYIIFICFVIARLLFEVRLAKMKICIVLITGLYFCPTNLSVHFLIFKFIIYLFLSKYKQIISFFIFISSIFILLRFCIVIFWVPHFIIGIYYFVMTIFILIGWAWLTFTHISLNQYEENYFFIHFYLMLISY